MYYATAEIFNEKDIFLLFVEEEEFKVL